MVLSKMMTKKSDIPNNWAFKEAHSILECTKWKIPEKGYILLETGYGPSGLPHIGTFGEVVRTSMVKQALSYLVPEIPVKIFVISDDMDGLRKVPDNIPNPDMVKEYLDMPLSSIPDPFGKFESYSAYMNNKLKEFLRGFEYDFKSATECYKSGIYNEMLLKILENYDGVMSVILPTLGDERRETYSPFLPICPETGRVLQVPVRKVNTDNGTIIYENNGKLLEVPVIDGHCKLQWKPDWGMRWAAFNVDYEMHGKDLIPSAALSSRICKIINNKIPILSRYELFLDEEGHKISKSKGNGISYEEWMRYSVSESLSFYMFHAPHKAKRLYFDVIPKATDDYLSSLCNYENQSSEDKLTNPVWLIHNGDVPKCDIPSGITFSLLLNLASACNSENESILWGFLKKYADVDEENLLLSHLVKRAINYYNDFILLNKKYHIPSSEEFSALRDLAVELEKIGDVTVNEYQTLAFDIGKKHNFVNLREWFQLIYKALLGQEQGPRIGSFYCLVWQRIFY